METTSTRYIEKSLMKKEKSSKAPFGGFADRCMICKIFKFYLKKLSLHIKMIENECCEWGPCLYTPVYYLSYSIRTLESYGKDPMEILFQGGGGASEATLIP